MTKPTIWCLFSVAQEYDQPDNNLSGWWTKKPSLQELADYLVQPLDAASDEAIVAIVAIWRGERATLPHDSYFQYRLEEVEEGGCP